MAKTILPGDFDRINNSGLGSPRYIIRCALLEEIPKAVIAELGGKKYRGRWLRADHVVFVSYSLQQLCRDLNSARERAPSPLIA